MKESEKRVAELRDLLASRDSRIGDLEAERTAVAAVEQASTPPAGVPTAELEELRQRARELETLLLVWKFYFDLRSLHYEIVVAEKCASRSVSYTTHINRTFKSHLNTRALLSCNIVSIVWRTWPNRASVARLRSMLSKSNLINRNRSTMKCVVSRAMYTFRVCFTVQYCSARNCTACVLVCGLGVTPERIRGCPRAPASSPRERTTQIISRWGCMSAAIFVWIPVLNKLLITLQSTIYCISPLFAWGYYKTLHPGQSTLTSVLNQTENLSSHSAFFAGGPTKWEGAAPGRVGSFEGGRVFAVQISVRRVGIYGSFVFEYHKYCITYS